MEVWTNLLFLEDLLIGEVYESKIVTARQKSFTQCTGTPAEEDAGLAQEEPHRAPLNAALWTILRVASLNWGSEQSFITKPRPWSRRSGRWWGPSPGTPWRRTAGSSGPGSRLSSLLKAVLLYELILSMFLCQHVFNTIKSYGFQLWCVKSKKLNENSGFIAATLYSFTSTQTLPLSFQLINAQWSGTFLGLLSFAVNLYRYVP